MHKQYHKKVRKLNFYFFIKSKTKNSDTLNNSTCGKTQQYIIIKYKLKKNTSALCFKRKQNKFWIFMKYATTKRKLAL